MRYLILLSTAVLLMFLSGAAINAQQQVTVTQQQIFPKAGDTSCQEFKMIIIVPPKGMDRQIINSALPKDFDQAMVWNPCQEQGQATPLAPPNNLQPLKIQPGINILSVPVERNGLLNISRPAPERPPQTKDTDSLFSTGTFTIKQTGPRQ